MDGMLFLASTTQLLQEEFLFRQHLTFAITIGTETGLILNTLEGEGSQALFWTSKKVYPSNSGNMRWAFSIHANTRMTGMGFTQLSETCGLAVRCIKDDEW